VAGAEAQEHGDDLRGREHTGGSCGGEAALVVEVEHQEAEEDHLRRDVQAAAAAQEPELPVPQRPGHVVRLDALARQLAHDGVTGQRARSTEHAEEEQGRLDTAGVDEARERECADDAPDRNRGLPDAEREAALAGREPLHHGAATGRLDAGADTPGRREQQPCAERGVHLRHGGEQHTAPPEPDREGAPLADPIGDEPPRQQRERQADPLSREQNSDALEPELVLLPQAGGDGRQSERDGGEARLRRRAGGENGPAVAVCRYRPNGLNGFGDVETRTLFVSR
jgi:hypothetical protein